MNDSITPQEEEFLRTLSALYVEDEEEVRTQLARFLRRRFAHLDVAENGRHGLELFEHGTYDVVITDVKMPLMDGLEMAGHIKEHRDDMPVIVVTAYNETDYFLRAIEVGVDRYVKKPVNTDLLIQAVYKATRVRAQEKELERARAHELEILTQTVAALARAIEMRDPYTDGHQKRVSRIAVAIGEEMGLPAEQVTGIRLGALVHDVGKIAVPAELLVRPRVLEEHEFAVIKAHADAGREILDEVEFPWPIRNIVRQHHERFDGSGYPEGVSGEAIALEARIVAVADVVEAISFDRPYRAARGIAAAIEEITAGRGTRYDPVVVDACLAVLSRSDPEQLVRGAV